MKFKPKHQAQPFLESRITTVNIKSRYLHEVWVDRTIAGLFPAVSSGKQTVVRIPKE